jgi:hypothetical protein
MRLVVLAWICLVLAPAVPAGPTSPCSDEKSKQFDFWIGEWTVFADGKPVGKNSIRPILDGCVLQESWSGSSGSAGSSFNFYDPGIGKWRQFWVWRKGTTLELEGGYANGKMVLSGESTSRDGQTLLNRITWHDNVDGTVRQHWQISKDGGKTWTTAFNGLYRRS